MKKCRPSVSVVGDTVYVSVEGPWCGPGHTVVLMHWAFRGHEVLEDGLMLLCWYRGKLLEWQLLGLLPGEVHITQGGDRVSVMNFKFGKCICHLM